MCAVLLTPLCLQIGWYSENEGLHIKEDFILLQGAKASSRLPETPRTSPLVNSDRSSHSRAIATEDQEEDRDLEEAVVDDESEVKADRDMAVLAGSYESFIGRTWSLVVISIALFGICVSLWMMVYVFLKMCDGTLSGNQSMGVLLLLGVMLTFASTVPWLLPPSEVICAVRHFLHPLAFCLCFGLLLLKVMQLRSLVSVGLGGTIPQVRASAHLSNTFGSATIALLSSQSSLMEEKCCIVKPYHLETIRLLCCVVMAKFSIIGASPFRLTPVYHLCVSRISEMTALASIILQNMMIMSGTNI